MKTTLHFIHGFLGTSSDWDRFVKDPGHSSLEVLTYDLFRRVPKGLQPSSFPESLPALGDWVNQQARKKRLDSRRNILIGYSLGGRIALHALTQAPEMWSGAVLASTHPGLESQA